MSTKLCHRPPVLFSIFLQSSPEGTFLLHNFVGRCSRFVCGGEARVRGSAVADLREEVHCSRLSGGGSNVADSDFLWRGSNVADILVYFV